MFKLDILNDLQQNVKIGMKQNMYVTHGDAWFEEKTKTEYTIWSIARGNIYIKIAEKEYAASAGDAVLFCPGIRYLSLIHISTSSKAARISSFCPSSKRSGSSI